MAEDRYTFMVSHVRGSGTLCAGLATGGSVGAPQQPHSGTG